MHPSTDFFQIWRKLNHFLFYYPMKTDICVSFDDRGIACIHQALFSAKKTLTISRSFINNTGTLHLRFGERVVPNGLLYIWFKERVVWKPNWGHSTWNHWKISINGVVLLKINNARGRAVHRNNIWLSGFNFDYSLGSGRAIRKMGAVVAEINYASNLVQPQNNFWRFSTTIRTYFCVAYLILSYPRMPYLASDKPLTFF